jgi:hypothetical protein
MNEAQLVYENLRVIPVSAREMKLTIIVMCRARFRRVNRWYWSA